MPDGSSLVLFVPAALALLVVPGPSVLYIVTQSVSGGLLFIALAVVSDGAWALLAGTAAGWLRGNPRFVHGERVVSGGVLVGLGLATAVTGPRKS